MLFVVILFIYSISAEIEHHKFQEWKIKYNKVYSSPQAEKIGFTNFLETVQRVQKRVSVSPKGGATFGLSQFADLSSAEFRAKYLMAKELNPTNHSGPPKRAKSLQVPSNFDWRDLGAVTSVQNQGKCGSCWAFAATATIESAWMLKYNLTNETMKPLSNQQIIDCDKEDSGCDGGDPRGAYEYIIAVGGQETNSNYPYNAKDGTCGFQKQNVYAKIQSFDYACSPKQEKELLESTFGYGPLTVCVDARNWQDYISGVMTAWDCSWFNTLNHCVQVVGWDLTPTSPYWVLRNSWGTNWGEDGFIRLQYGHNTCGMSTEATFVVPT